MLEGEEGPAVQKSMELLVALGEGGGDRSLDALLHVVGAVDFGVGVGHLALLSFRDRDRDGSGGGRDGGNRPADADRGDSGRSSAPQSSGAANSGSEFEDDVPF